MKLETLLRDLDTAEVRGDADIPVTGVAYDSRRVDPGNVFVCLEGLTVDGHRFAQDTVERGATSLVVQRWLPQEVTQVKVPDSRDALAHLSSAFFRRPWEGLVMLGVTGTNGKTTVTHFLQGIGRAAGRATEVMGTLGSTGFTTPEAPMLQEFLRGAADGDTAWVAMECSSHALAQRRVLGTRFDVVVFTNLSRDHLDYHRTMEAYFAAKAVLFERSYRKDGGAAVICIDDDYGRKLWEAAPGPKISYGLAPDAQVRARDLTLQPGGSAYRVVWGEQDTPVTLRVPGRYNVLNALAAQASALHLGVPPEVIARGLESVTAVSGRMEPVPGNGDIHVYVDYAHTPDGLRFALEALREVTTGRLWVVFGCGGDRDPGKRPLMGKVAENLADRVVVTSDNPRSEAPEAILEAVVQGLERPGDAHLEADRRRAIAFALHQAHGGDTVLIAGKGHETQQILKDGPVDFDDRAVAAEVLKERDAGAN